MKSLSGLAKNTKKVFITLSGLEEMKRFTFVGGSALSIYLQHRLSEDLDFFSWENHIEADKLLQKIENIFPGRCSASNISNRQLDASVDGVRITFFANNWEALKNNEPLLNHVHIASLRLLTAMKVNTLFLRAKYRDYYDLYVLNKRKYTVNEMFEIAAETMPQINKKLFQMSLVYTDDIEDDNINHLKPAYHVSKEEIGKHFEDEIRKWLSK